MKLLVTGARGYVGGRLCRFLAEYSSHEVVCGSRSATHGMAGTFAAAVTDWSSEESLYKACEGAEAVVHLAAMNAADCAADPAGALAMNGVATARLLQAAKKAGVRRFIYLSTAHVYGSPLTGAISENSWPCPLHPYATSHRAAEDIVLAADKLGQIEGIVLRMSNAFGAPADPDANCWDLLFNDLCRQAVTTGGMTLRSSGMQRRDFLPMTDVCRAILHFLDLPLARQDRRLFNLGGNWSPTVFEAANIAADRCAPLLGARPSVSRVEPAVGEVAADLSYVTDALQQTGFRLSADRTAEIDALISFCMKTYGASA